MFYKKNILCVLLLALFTSSQPALARYKVGLCVMATGRYDIYAQRMIESARKYFLKNQDVTYFVFTDGHVQESADVVQIYQKRLGWPHDTLLRFAVYAQYEDLLSQMDYLYALDADMLFVDEVGDEILSDLVGTQHPGYIGQRGTYETNSISTACVRRYEGAIYFAGGFYGGKTTEVLTLLKTLVQKIEADATKKFIAVWHDESHLNRYFIDHKPTLVLTPSYCYPESWRLPYKKRLLALDKNHNEMRKVEES